MAFRYFGLLAVNLPDLENVSGLLIVHFDRISLLAKWALLIRIVGGGKPFNYFINPS